MEFNLPRRAFLKLTASAIPAAALAPAASAEQATAQPQRQPTRFQIACMTLPYSQFPLQRALTGLRNAGYAYVAWGTSHMEEGKRMPVIAADAPVGRAKALSSRCRDLGLEPGVMLSGIYPEAT